MRHNMKVTVMMAIRVEETRAREAATEVIEVEGEEEVPTTGIINLNVLYVFPKDTISMNVDLIPQQREGGS